VMACMRLYIPPFSACLLACVLGLRGEITSSLDSRRMVMDGYRLRGMGTWIGWANKGRRVRLDGVSIE
jgi:hypothetical protein